jgi:hypothetical protein
LKKSSSRAFLFTLFLCLVRPKSKRLIYMMLLNIYNTRIHSQIFPPSSNELVTPLTLEMMIFAVISFKCWDLLHTHSWIYWTLSILSSIDEWDLITTRLQPTQFMAALKTWNIEMRQQVLYFFLFENAKWLNACLGNLHKFFSLARHFKVLQIFITSNFTIFSEVVLL